MGGRTRKQKPGARSSPSPPRQEERRTSSHNQRKTHEDPEPATSENASAQDSWRPSGDSRWQPSRRLPPREPGALLGGEFSDDEGSPEETRKIPVQTNLNLNRGIDYKTVLLSGIVSAAVAVAVVLVVSKSRQSDPIYVPVGTQDAEALEAIQTMQETLRGEFDGKLAKLRILDESEVQDIVKSTLKPYMDHIENHLLQDRVKQIVREMLAEISIPSDKSIMDIAMKVVQEQLASKLQERDNNMSQKLKEMEDRLGKKIEEGTSPPDDGLKAEVGRLKGMVERLEQRGDTERIERQTQLSELHSALDSRLTGTKSQVQALLRHEVQYSTEKLQGETRQAYMLCAGSLLLAVVALVVACSSRTARPAAPAPSSANPPSTTAANPPPTTAKMGSFVAGLGQREKKEMEALSQWRGTLERAVCVVHFGRDFQQHHRQQTQRVMQGVTQGQLLEAKVGRTEDIAKVPGARLYVLFVNFNERNVILESPEKGTGELRLTTVQALQRRGAEVVVIYAGNKESAGLSAGQLYNRYLTSVQSHPVLSQLSSKQHFLSIDTDFLDHQHQHLQQVVKAALN